MLRFSDTSMPCLTQEDDPHQHSRHPKQPAAITVGSCFTERLAQRHKQGG
jgi:hypothetical protein